MMSIFQELDRYSHTKKQTSLSHYVYGKSVSLWAKPLGTWEKSVVRSPNTDISYNASYFVYQSH